MRVDFKTRLAQRKQDSGLGSATVDGLFVYLVVIYLM